MDGPPVIHKAFNLDGTPDYTRWAIGCDLCPERSALFGTCPDCGLWHFTQNLVHWLIPRYPQMSVYCPACLGEYSATFIDLAVYCPGCGSNDLRFCSDSSLCEPISVECADCGSYTYGSDRFPGSKNGWIIR